MIFKDTICFEKISKYSILRSQDHKETIQYTEIPGNSGKKHLLQTDKFLAENVRLRPK